MFNRNEEIREREAREYFRLSDSEHEARGMPPWFKEYGYTPPPPEVVAHYLRRAIVKIPNLEDAAEIGEFLEQVEVGNEKKD